MAIRIYRDGLEPIADALQAMAEDLTEQDVVLAMLPVLYREIDRKPEAIGSYRIAAARRTHVARDATWLIYAWALGVSCRYADGEDTAQELYEELLPYADRWAVSTPSICFGPVSLALAGYASVLGWHDAALAHVETALASATAAHAPVFVAAALVEQAEVLLARGDDDDRTPGPLRAQRGHATSRSVSASPPCWLGPIASRPLLRTAATSSVRTQHRRAVLGAHRKWDRIEADQGRGGIAATSAAAARTWKTAWPWSRLSQEHSGPPVRLSVCSAAAATASTATRGRTCNGRSLSRAVVVEAISATKPDVVHALRQPSSWPVVGHAADPLEGS